MQRMILSLFSFSGKRLLASESSFVAEHSFSKCLKKRADS
jgi:hypothetical protein